MGISRYAGDHVPWTYTWTPGPALANLYALYPSQGDVTIATATNIVTTEDGPVQVVRYENLTVNAKLSTTKRCRGFIPLYRDIHIGAGGDISMTGRGAKGHGGWVVDDLTVPESVTISGRYGSPHAVLKLIGERGWYIGDPNLWANPPAELATFGVTAEIIKGAVLVSASGCGASRSGFVVAANGAGSVGNAGANAPGGGGIGGYYNGGSNTLIGWSGAGYPWGGGPGSGGSSGVAVDPSIAGADYCGKGGRGSGYGAGNPAGDGSESGVGGIVIAIGTGDATIDSGGVIQADGMPSLSGNYTSGGGSGGGRAMLIHGGTLSNAGTIRANGGAYAAGTYHGGPGGAGAADTKTFAQMGWAA